MFCTCNLWAQNIIVKIAGNDSAGFCCDGGPATNAALNFPCQLCLDRFGNIYVADADNQRVRKIVISTGIITTIAGNGNIGYSGDNGPATDARLAIPDAVCVDTSGNLYIADGLTHRVRKVTMSTGIITTFAGNGSSGNTGDGGPATLAEIQSPAGLSADNAGNIYITDIDNNNIRKVDENGIITTVAGNGTLGYTGDGGPATNATFSTPGKAIVDNLGNLIITDDYNNVIRKVDASTGIITTIAGTGVAGYSGDNGPAINAKLNGPYGVYIDKQNSIFFAEFHNGTIRKIDGITGIITTVAGCGIQGITGDGGPATAAELAPDDVVLDSFGTMYIADYGNQRIRKVYNPKLAVLNETLQTGIVKLFPNPAGSEINIIYEFSNQRAGVFQLFDISSRLVMSSVLAADRQREVLNIRDLSKGVYIFKVVQHDKVLASGELIKQ